MDVLLQDDCKYVLYLSLLYLKTSGYFKVE